MIPSAASRRFWLGIAFALAAAVVGEACADSCMQIQDALCQCRGRTTDEINSCETTQSTQESLAPPTTAQLSVCAKLVPGCNAIIDGGSNCEVLQTPTGKQACGIANEPTSN